MQPPNRTTELHPSKHAHCYDVISTEYVLTPASHLVKCALEVHKMLSNLLQHAVDLRYSRIHTHQYIRVHNTHAGLAVHASLRLSAMAGLQCTTHITTHRIQPISIEVYYLPPSRNTLTHAHAHQAHSTAHGIVDTTPPWPPRARHHRLLACASPEPQRPSTRTTCAHSC